MTIWSILRLLAVFCSHLVYFMIILFIFSHFGRLYQKNLASLECMFHVVFNDKHIFAIYSTSSEHIHDFLRERVNKPNFIST
jgi:hypothetical protein